MKGQGGGGTAKGGGKSRSGGGSVAVRTVTVAKDKKAKEVEDSGHILLLRSALFETNGKDKDVCAGLSSSFMKYDRNGIDVSIEFATKLSEYKTKLRESDAEYCFGLVKDNMMDKYDASGYGWDDDDKYNELTEPGARFLLIREWPEDDQEKGNLVGFIHFRFTVQGEVIDKMAGDPCLYIYDIHLEDHLQRKGLGKHLMLGDEDSRQWVMKMQRGYEVDQTVERFGLDKEMEGFEVFSKRFPPIVKISPPIIPITNNDNNAAEIIKDQTAASLPLPPVPPNKIEEEESSLVLQELQKMFIDKNGREPSPLETREWRAAVSQIQQLQQQQRDNNNNDSDNDNDDICDDLDDNDNCPPGLQQTDVSGEEEDDGGWVKL